MDGQEFLTNRLVLGGRWHVFDAPVWHLSQDKLLHPFHIGYRYGPLGLREPIIGQHVEIHDVANVGAPTKRQQFRQSRRVIYELQINVGGIGLLVKRVDLDGP